MPETMPGGDDASQPSARPGGGVGSDQGGAHHGDPRPGGGGPASPLLTELRSLRRARDGRVLAGVCAGIGQRLNVDPVVLRVLVVALALFGGPGFLLYGGAWLLIPEEGEELSILERQLGRRRDGTPDKALFVAGLIVLGMLMLTAPWWGPPWNVPILLFLSVLGLLYLVRRNAQGGPDSSARGAGFGGTPPAWPGAGVPVDDTPTQPFPSPTTTVGGPSSSAPGGRPAQAATAGEPEARTEPSHEGSVGSPSGPGSGPADDTDAMAGNPSPTLPLSPTGSWRDLPPPPPSFWDQPDPLGLEDEPEPEPPTAPAQPRRRPWLFVGTTSAALVVVGLLGLVSVVAGTIPPAGYVAAALAVVGVGLIVGTWIGRSFALVAVGVLLSLSLVPLTFASHWSGSTVDMTFRPTTTEEIRPRYDYSAGSLVLDLRDVTFDEDAVTRTSISLGSGQVVVLLPPDVDVRLTGDVGMGRILPFSPEGWRGANHEVAGFGASVERLDTGYDGRGGGQLDLTIDVGMGNVELRRG
jgi:phage shock protein PspC (stress-responsive transcriptional regulator)